MKALDMILFWANMNYHPVYEQYLVEKYEEENGPHFDEKHARDCVDKMWHTEGNETICGENWSIEEVEKVKSQYKLCEKVTKWDVYVALHSFYHDMCTKYKSRGHEVYLIQDAIRFFFEDEDAEDGKIWRYTHMY